MLSSFLSFRQKAADDDKENQSKNADGGKLKKKPDGDKLKKKKKKTADTSGATTTLRPLMETRRARVSLESDAIPRKRKRGKPKDDENSPAPKE